MEEKVKVENEVKEEVKVRKDLNGMVKSIKLKTETNKYGERTVCIVTLFNNETIQFNDTDGVYDLLKSYKVSGEKGYIKSMELVECVKNAEVDLLEDVANDGTSTYICVLFTLADGGTYRLFPSKKFVARKIIDNYYKQWKNQNKSK